MDVIIYPHIVWGKAVSSPFRPLPTDTPDGELIVRAWIQCPECLERNAAD